MNINTLKTVMIMILFAAALAAFPPGAAAQSAGSKDSTITLKGGEEGTAFRSMTVEGEDRVKIEFERPPLKLDLDPSSAPGLDWDSTWEIIGRTDIDFLAPLIGSSAGERSPYMPRPWLDEFDSGDLVRFRPSLEEVDSWKLDIVDSRGTSVISFRGDGSPPEEIAWDGLSSEDKPAPPGLTYSYVLEAHDRAGNKRNFVGEGFRLPSYQIDTGRGMTLIFSGKKLESGSSVGRSRTPAILLDAASRINQLRTPGRLVRIEATARSYREASALADRVRAGVTPLLLGDPGGVKEVTEVQPDAPSGGTVAIVVMRQEE
ncbi:MAG: hypothetical protein ACQERI_08115 [Candidatus Krumholzibacteriota bacterium]